MPGPIAAAVARTSPAAGVPSPLAGVAEPGDLAADGLPDARRDRHLLDGGRALAEQSGHL